MNTPNRDALVAAQFMMKPKLYAEWIWQERQLEHPDRLVPRPRVFLTFAQRNDPKVVRLPAVTFQERIGQ